MPAYVRQMCRDDVAQVSEIDREAFPTEWPPPNFKSELENQIAHYIVACDAEKVVDTPRAKTSSKKGFARLVPGLRKLFGRGLFSSNGLVPNEEHVIGFAGFWVMADEAHVTSIASRKTYRRKGIGELLLMVIIDQAVKFDARIVTLEVRVSNTTAQNLYSKYGFTQVGLRPGYYTDNKEDAILMSTETITSPTFQAGIEQLKQAHSLKWGTSHYRVER